MRYSFRILDRGKSLVVHREGDENYCATAQIVTYGDMALMHSINGVEAYELMGEQLHDVMAALKIERLEGFVTDAHLRLMRFKLRHVGNVEVARLGEIDGKRMNWVVVTAKPVVPAVDYLIEFPAESETVDILKAKEE